MNSAGCNPVKKEVIKYRTPKGVQLHPELDDAELPANFADLLKEFRFINYHKEKESEQ